ncbi:MAG: hypothetical protein ABIH37_01700 [archaeon]
MKIQIVDVLLILFGIFIAYELILKLIYNSVDLDLLIIALLMFNLIVTWKMGTSFTRRISEL